MLLAKNCSYHVRDDGHTVRHLQRWRRQRYLMGCAITVGRKSLGKLRYFRPEPFRWRNKGMLNGA